MAYEWYHVKNVSEADSPSLLIYPARVQENIRLLLSMSGDAGRLRPHIKTHKTREAVSLMMAAGIDKFKCATISEAEMLAMAGAGDVLLAYQPQGPKIKRLISLVKQYPGTAFSCVIDNVASAENIAAAAAESHVQIPVYIDLNVGMNRTGIEPGDAAVALYIECSRLKGIRPAGLHAYDGHIRTKDFRQRTAECNEAFRPVQNLKDALIKQGHDAPIIIAGGSPTFPVHVNRNGVECSPGTFIFWDRGYQLLCEEQPFMPAALVLTRVISAPGPGKLCLDLGHKSVSAENELNKRVYFLNAPDMKFISQSEEHLVVETALAHTYAIGDELYGLPFHICPTCALYERALTVDNNELTGEWKIIARDRKINI